MDVIDDLFSDPLLKQKYTVVILNLCIMFNEHMQCYDDYMAECIEIHSGL